MYDGHGGRKAAELASANLHQAVLDAGLPLDQVWAAGLVWGEVAGADTWRGGDGGGPAGFEGMQESDFGR